MRYLRIAAILAFLPAFGLPSATAAAKPGVVPPGNSGASQYTETLPGPEGDEPTSGAQSEGKGSSPEAVLGAGNARRLEQSGPLGRKAAELAAATAPRSAAAGAGQSRGGAGSSLGDAGQGSPALRQLAGEVTGSSDSGGMGLLLPLLIAMSVTAAIAYLAGRRRSARKQI